MLSLVTSDVRQSAGILLLNGEKALVVKRSKRSRNPGRWGLPGGRLEENETWYHAATRESVEELNSLPAHGIVGSMTLHRARRVYAIFACRSRKKILRKWSPNLNHEHEDWRWASYKWIRHHPDVLHPVLKNVITNKTGRHWLRKMMTETSVADLTGGRRETDG